jgi:hypothetical protein
MRSSSWRMRSAHRAIFCSIFALVLAASCGDDDDGDHDDDAGDHDQDQDSGHEEGTAGDGDHDPSKPIGTPSGATCPDGNTLTYDTFGKPFMDKYCVRCHSTKLKTDVERMFAPPGHDFDVFEGIIGVAEHVDQYAAAGPDKVNTMMPPSGAKPTMEEREQLGQWLACELDMLE